MSAEAYIVGAVVFLAMLYLAWPAKKPACPGSRPVQATPGIASHDKWKASLNAYKEGALTLEAFLDAWSGWVIAAPSKPMTATDIVKRGEEYWAGPGKAHLDAMSDARDKIMKPALDEIMRFMGSHNPRYGQITGVDYGPGQPGDYGPLNTAKRKLGS